MAGDGGERPASAAPTRARPLLAVYTILAAAGAALPLSRFVPWLADNGADLPLFVGELFGNRVSALFALDVIVSAVVVILFVLAQGRRDGVRPLWLPVAATLLVGVSCGLPLFLALREIALAGRRAGG